MSVNLIRVINQQTIVRSILIDKIDCSQGNSPGYAQKTKQKIYVPYANPLDSTVKGYTDLIPTDEVLLSANSGTIKKLSSAGKVSFAIVSSDLVATPGIAAFGYSAGTTIITGNPFLSVAPDVTYAILTNLVGVTQKVPQTSFDTHSGTNITILDGVITIGTPTTGWKVQVQANSKLSNQYTL